MTDLHIATLQTHFHTAATDPCHGRIRDIQQSLLETHLEAAAGMLAINEEEIVCIRRLYIRLTINKYQTDYDVARRWGESITGELHRALFGDAGFDVVRFPNRLVALQQFADDVKGGDLRRTWVWKKLGFVSADFHRHDAQERFTVLVSQVIREPTLIIPLLRQLTYHAMLNWFAQSVSEHQLSRVVEVAVRAVGSEIDIVSLLADNYVSRESQKRTKSEVDRLLNSPGFLEFLTIIGKSTRLEVQKYWATLALLVVQSDVCRLNGALQVQLVNTLLQIADRGDPNVPETAIQEAEEESITDLHETTTVPVGELPAEDLASVERAYVLPGIEEPRDDDGIGMESVQVDQQEHAGSVEGMSAFGGLLFLLPVVEESGALHWLLRDASLARLDFAERLHRLALVIYPLLPVDDPALRAFAGLMPDQTTPGDPLRPLDAPQLEMLHVIKEKMIDVLVRRLPHWLRPALLQQVIERPAMVMAYPGWFEIRYRLKDASVDIRRAALDLDPGFIPWLGVVMRYVYE